ncbi:NAD-dependent histone deacetylase sir2 [Mortierella antarctica]|nr:NAD-dependent histone deacetylase sir2 [Mortierella antarctica]
MSQPPSASSLQRSDERPAASEDDTSNKHAAKTGPTLVTSSLPASASQLVSPVTRKRNDVKDDDGGYELDFWTDDLDVFQDCSEGRGRSSSSTFGSNGRSFPPLKKSKTSPPLASTRVTLTDYRSSRETGDDDLSPQTSPILAPTDFKMTLPALDASRQRDSPPARPPGMPALIRSRTLDEFKPTMPPMLSRTATSTVDILARSSQSAIAKLNLGSSASSRATVPGRAMGVITSQPNSRQASPALAAVNTKDKESTPPQGQKDQGPDRFHGDQRYPSPCLSDLMASSEDDPPRQRMQDLLNEYDEDMDADYEPTADTTVDESFHRHYSSESEDDDSYSAIDVGNIAAALAYTDDEDSDDDHTFGDSVYVDKDPLSVDRLTEDEEEHIMGEAREYGLNYVVRKYILSRVHSAKKMLLMTSAQQIMLPSDWTEAEIIALFKERLQYLMARGRRRLPHVHSLKHVADLLRNSKNIMILTGAGVSVSCGIPDFRSPNGIYSRLSEFKLQEPQQMFDLDFFCDRPEVFYSFAREIFPSNFVPSPSHYFIKLVEEQGKLIRNYTQNIDTLEQKAGISKVLQCHGSFATASCIRCKYPVPGDDIKEAIFKQEVAYCKLCTDNPVPPAENDSGINTHGTTRPLMKPDIVFFNERLPTLFEEYLEEDRNKVDLLIVIGSSLKVAPVGDVMHQLPRHVPQILINRTPIIHSEFDVQLLGNCDVIVAELCRMVGWELKHEMLPGGTSYLPDMASNTNDDGSGEGGRAPWTLVEPNTYLFEGAILQDIEYEFRQSQGKGGEDEEGGYYSQFALPVIDDQDMDDDADDEGPPTRMVSESRFCYKGSRTFHANGVKESATFGESRPGSSVGDFVASAPSDGATTVKAAESDLLGMALGTLGRLQSQSTRPREISKDLRRGSLEDVHASQQAPSLESRADDSPSVSLEEPTHQEPCS